MTKTCLDCWPADCGGNCLAPEPQLVNCSVCGCMTPDQQDPICMGCQHLKNIESVLPEALNCVPLTPDQHLLLYKKMLEKMLRAIRKEAKSRGL